MGGPCSVLCPQSLREALAEHRPLLGKLQRVTAQLQELSPDQAAPFRQRCGEADELYGCIRQRLHQAATLLEDALPRYSQVRSWAGTGGDTLLTLRVTGAGVSPQLSERMDVLRECLERLQRRLQSQPGARGDAVQLREQLQDNALALAELEQLGAALATVQAQGEELLGSVREAGCGAAAAGLHVPW